MRIATQLKTTVSTLSFVAMCSLAAGTGARAAYDPLSTVHKFTPEILDIEVHDNARQRQGEYAKRVLGLV